MKKNKLNDIFPTTKKIWTLADAISEAKKYKSKLDFIKKGAGAYNWLRNNSPTTLDNLFPIIRKKWTIHSALKEAKKYKSRKEFAKNSPGAYQWLLKHEKEEFCYICKKPLSPEGHGDVFKKGEWVYAVCLECLER